MKTCEQRDELQARLRATREELYSVKDIPGTRVLCRVVRRVFVAQGKARVADIP